MKKKFLLLALAVLCLSMLFGATLIAHADRPEMATAIKGHNLSLDDSIHVLYYVDETAPAGAETGVLCWYGEQESYTLANKQYQLKSIGTESGYTLYDFPYVAAKMMTTDIYAVSYVKVGDEITYSKLDKYSVLQYCYNKKGSTTILNNGTATLGELVTNILNYGAVAQKYFSYKTNRLANATYYQIKVENGTLADNTAKGLYQAGEEVTLHAPAESNGVPFFAWKNETGATVGTERNLQITAEANNTTYTAVYEEIITAPTIKVETVCASSNDQTVSVAIFIQNNPGIASLKMSVTYGNKLTLTNVAFDSAYGAYVTAPVPYINPQDLSFMSPFSGVNSSGTFATLTFQIDGVIAETTEVDVCVTLDQDNTFNEDFDEVVFRVLNGKVIINP